MMITIPQIDDGTRLRVLLQELRDLRRASDRLGAGDRVHALANAIQTAQAALGLAEGRLRQGRTEEVARLLALAEERMREGRRLIAGRRRLSGAGRIRSPAPSEHRHPVSRIGWYDPSRCSPAQLHARPRSRWPSAPGVSQARGMPSMDRYSTNYKQTIDKRLRMC